MESQPQNAELGRLYNIFSNYFSDYLNTINHEIIRFCRHDASLKMCISKVKDFGIFELTHEHWI